MNKRSKFVWVTESQVIDTLFRAVEKEIDSLSGEDRISFNLYKEKLPIFPKRWGGYELPLPLISLTIEELEKFEEHILTYSADIAFAFYEDSYKSNSAGISAVLVDRCKKSKEPGLLVYWKK